MNNLDTLESPATNMNPKDTKVPATRVVEGRVVSAKRPKSRPPRAIPPGLMPFKPGESGSTKTQWPKGVSGNPSGRSHKAPISDAMKEMLAAPYIGPNKRYRDRKFTNAQALAAKQLELAINQGDMRAAEELANRTEGKVLSVTQLQGVNGGPIEISAMSPEEKRARIAELLRQKIPQVPELPSGS